MVRHTSAMPQKTTAAVHLRARSSRATRSVMTPQTTMPLPMKSTTTEATTPAWSGARS